MNSHPSSALTRSVTFTLFAEVFLSISLVFIWDVVVPEATDAPFQISTSISDLALLALFRVIVSVTALTWPTRWAVHGIIPSKIRPMKLRKALGWARNASFIAASLSGNYALVKAMSLVFTDILGPNHGHDSNNTDIALSFETAKSQDDTATNLPLFWAGLMLAVFFSIFDHKTVTKALQAFEVSTLNARRASRKKASSSSEHVAVNVNYTDSAIENSLDAPLLANEVEASATSTAGETNADDEDSSDDDDDDTEEENQELERLAKTTGRSTVTDGVRLRLRERKRRALRDQRKKKREKKDLTGKRGSGVRDLLQFAVPDIPYLIFAFICLTTAAVTQALIPFYTGKVINYVSGAHPDEEAFYHTLKMLVLAAIICGIASGLRGSTFIWCAARLGTRVRQALFESLLKQEVGYFDVTSTGDITSRLSSDTTKMSDQMGNNVNVFFRSLVESGLYLVLMVSISWKLALLSFVSIPILTALSSEFTGYYRKVNKQTQDALADANTIAEETLASMSTVRDFASEKAEAESYAEELQEFLAVTFKQVKMYTAFAQTWSTLPSMVTVLTLYYGGQFALTPEDHPAHMRAGDLVSFMLYQQALSQTVQSFGFLLTGISGALGAADKVFAIINRKPEITPPGSLQLGTTDSETSNSETGANSNGHAAIGVAHPNGEFEGTITMENVSFTYPARPGVVVLKSLNLHVPNGKVVALVGPSGGGKSSCMRLIQHYYEPSEGRVLISGKPVEDFDPAWLRRHVAIVGQEPTLFGRSIRRNIIYGLEGTTDEPSQADIEEAALQSNAHEFIMKMPKGYDTQVGERGVQLSGGQKQRIALARSLVRKPKVLLLDEATSALDTESEAVVQAALDKIMKQQGRTVLVIAHRLSTVKNADLIVCIADGKVAEQGTHDDLLAVKGVYATLVQRQIEGMTTTSDASRETK